MGSIRLFARLLLIHGFAVYPMLSHAQLDQTQLETSLNKADSSLRQLDILAEQCLQGDSEPCAEFMAAIDGKILEDYIDQCRQLENWKQHILEASLQSTNQTSTSAAQLQLQFIARIEKLCSEDGLRNNTQFVFAAFSKSRQQQYRSNSPANTPARVRDLEFRLAEQQQRAALQNSIRQQQLRRQMDTRRQIDEQQNELLRQQIIRQN